MILLLLKYWQLVASVVAIVAFVVVVKVHDAKIEARGVQKERAATERRADENAKKANAARRTVDGLAPDRLLDRYSRAD